ncbi:MAG: hypothetical protein ACLUKN_12895 [Bacilli bacterium]
MFSTRLFRFTLYGISVITICSLPFFKSSTDATPRAFYYASVGAHVAFYAAFADDYAHKSEVGPFITSINSESGTAGLSISMHIPSMSSLRLCEVYLSRHADCNTR